MIDLKYFICTFTQMFVYVYVQYMYLSTFNINQFKTFFKYMDDLAISLV